ncbi:MAG: amino acid adenylation domain-containing protein, partial [Acidobacteriota bacterium]
MRETSVRAQAHQEMPFEKLVEALDPDRDPARHPFFQIAFQYLAYQAPTTLGGLDAEWLTAEGTTTKFDLTLNVVEHRGELVVEVEYATALFEASTIDRLMASYREALRSAFVDPAQRIGGLNVLPAAERRLLLVDWNRTQAPFPRRATLIDAVREQARRTPDAEALIVSTDDAVETLGYGALWRQVETLAGRLRGLGVGPEVPVVVCLDRRAELIVSLLAVLEAGGIYVPVDPDYPRERVGFTLDDTAARAVLTREALVGILPAAVIAGESATRLVVLDRPDALPPIVEARASERPATAPENLAYLIYTSGSTGRPKGVAIRHASAVAMVAWAHGVFSPEETAGTVAATSVCFDLSVYEIFVPLSRGGTLILADNALALPTLPTAARERATLINTVPSALRELLRDGHLPARLRTVNLAGEALPRDLVDRAYEETGVDDVYNLYGPSEDTTYSTFARVDAGTSPPIGRPVANTRAYVLDAKLRPTPRGVPGELYLAGDGLARGYFGRPELTADRFVPDPFAGELSDIGAIAGDRMYRTGDLVVYRDAGVLHYLGRLDHQVKVRGFRVELGEVEAWIGNHPSVKERVVVAHPDPTGSLRLVAYLVAEDGTTGDSSTLRRHLAEHLPEHAVPTAWVWLDRLPLTPNGKVDRKALPDPELGSESARWTAPRTDIETALAEIWGEVLDVDSPGVTTNFFELGGHSLLATRLVSRVRDRFAV